MHSIEKSKPLDLTKLDVAQDESCKALQYFVHQKCQANDKRCAERLDIIAYLRDGFPFEAVTNVLENTCVSRKELSGILHVSTRQLNRYGHDDRLSAEQSGFFYEFSRVYVRGLDIFGDKETFENWLQRPQMALGEQSPLSLLDTTEGFRMVNDLLSQIEYGFYS